MAHYLVTAKPKSDLDGRTSGQSAKERILINAAFRQGTHLFAPKRATSRGSYATWEEEDYCSPPLAEERAVALDKFFEDLSVASVRAGAGWQEINHCGRCSQS